MKLTHISCTQFAGVRDQSVNLTDGINVLYGKNESGKSTLVHLISRTLFQNARLDGRRDKDFRELYFPAAKKGSQIAGDFADGKISIETAAGTYTLSKEWGTDARCMLSTPDGVFRDADTINSILKDVLTYGEGVYTDMLLTSQYRSDIALQTLLDASQKTAAKQEIAEAVSQAFAESDGVSVDAIEQAIQGKIDEIGGKHWDVDREAPARKNGRWASGLGEILKAYYAMEDAKSVLDTISRLEAEVDQATAAYAKEEEAIRTAQEDFESFSAFADQLAIQNERQKAVQRLQEEEQKYTHILSEWPRLTAQLERTKALRAESETRRTLDLYAKAKKWHDEWVELGAKAAAVSCPTDRELSDARTAQKAINTLSNQLCGMNLNAAIHMLGNQSVTVRSLRTGEKWNISDEKAVITEAVSITIPGVMEMELSPANVDVEEVRTQLEKYTHIVADILKAYGAQSVEQLEKTAATYKEWQRDRDMVSNRLQALLGNTVYEELEQAAQQVQKQPRDRETVDAEIHEICAGRDIAGFIVQCETYIRTYEAEYGQIDSLKIKAFDTHAEWENVRKAMDTAQDIPAAYQRVADPEGHRALLHEKLENARRDREAALTALTTVTSRLETYKETVSENPAEDAARAESIFMEQKTLLAHWRHIGQVFAEQKEKIHDNPLEDIAAHFTRYLGMISDGKVSSEFPAADKLDMHIYSSDRLIDYNKLSEGTKETVSLAFRLAVLEHLFPDGGGVVVLDDPFANMDADRTAKSCELLKEFAKRHQVIFLTCKEEYADMLGVDAVHL